MAGAAAAAAAMPSPGACQGNASAACSANSLREPCGTSCLKRSIVQLPPIREWIASRPAQMLIVCGLKIEAAVEIERRAILVELGADPAAVGQHEVDLLGPESERAPDRSRPECISGPFARSIRTAARTARGWTGTRRITSSWTTRRVTVWPTIAGCAAEQAEQQRQQLQERHRSHHAARPHALGLRSEALNDQ